MGVHQDDVLGSALCYMPLGLVMKKRRAVYDSEGLFAYMGDLGMALREVRARLCHRWGSSLRKESWPQSMGVKAAKVGQGR